MAKRDAVGRTTRQEHESAGRLAWDLLRALLVVVLVLAGGWYGLVRHEYDRATFNLVLVLVVAEAERWS